MHGIAIRSKNLIEGIRKRGHDLQVLSAECNDLVDIPCEYNILPFNKEVPLAKVQAKQMDQVEKFCPDVIHIMVPSWPTISHWLYTYGLYNNIPIVVSHHVDLVKYAYKMNSEQVNNILIPLGVKYFYESASEYSSILCGPSRYALKEFTDRFKETHSKVRVFGTGIDKQIFSPKLYKNRECVAKKKKLLEDGHEGIVLYAGRLSPEKGFDIFLGVAKRNKNLLFVVCGEGPSKDWYEDYCRDNNIENVVFLGKKTQQELAIYYKISNALIYPSETETFGFVPVEAMAMGCPAIIPNTELYREIHSELSDSFVDVEELELEQKINNYCIGLDKVLKKRNEKKCIQYASRFTWESCVTDFENIYKESIEKKPKNFPAFKAANAAVELVQVNSLCPMVFAMASLFSFFMKK